MDFEQYLTPTPTIESEHTAVRAFIAAQGADQLDDPVACAVRLYYAVRDGFRYNPYQIDMSVDGLKATTTLAAKQGWCVTKAILLAACCRAQGIPARLGFADVRNHLSTERMRQHMQTDVFLWHGYTDIYLAGQWVKATPAFNIELCAKFRLRPLAFNGREDSIYHPFDLDGRQHMEYIRMRGVYADTPIAEITHTFQKHYSMMLKETVEADFDKDVEREVQS
ncbi:MAG: transglutaminase family protein [Ardenticatenaceae bacterium]|nr:transglutaminase family protein [Ardenticatenaceae bacterium]